MSFSPPMYVNNAENRLNSRSGYYTPVIGLSTVSFPGLQQKIVKIAFSDMQPHGTHKHRVLTAKRGKKHGSI